MAADTCLIHPLLAFATEIAATLNGDPVSAGDLRALLDTDASTYVPLESGDVLVFTATLQGVCQLDGGEFAVLSDEEAVGRYAMESSDDGGLTWDTLSPARTSYSDLDVAGTAERINIAVGTTNIVNASRCALSHEGAFIRGVVLKTANGTDNRTTAGKIHLIRPDGDYYRLVASSQVITIPFYGYWTYGSTSFDFDNPVAFQDGDLFVLECTDGGQYGGFFLLVDNSSDADVHYRYTGALTGDTLVSAWAAVAPGWTGCCVQTLNIYDPEEIAALSAPADVLKVTLTANRDARVFGLRLTPPDNEAGGMRYLDAEAGSPTDEYTPAAAIKGAGWIGAEDMWLENGGDSATGLASGWVLNNSLDELLAAAGGDEDLAAALNAAPRTSAREYNLGVVVPWEFACENLGATLSPPEDRCLAENENYGTAKCCTGNLDDSHACADRTVTPAAFVAAIDPAEVRRFQVRTCAFSGTPNATGVCGIYAVGAVELIEAE